MGWWCPTSTGYERHDTLSFGCSREFFALPCLALPCLVANKLALAAAWLLLLIFGGDECGSLFIFDPPDLWKVVTTLLPWTVVPVRLLLLA